MSLDIDAILGEYGLKCGATRRAKGGFAVETEKGTVLLKEYLYSVGGLEYSNALAKKLADIGYHYTENIIKNQNDELFTETPEGRRYIVKQWFSGRECDISDIEDIKKSIRGLATLHNALDKISDEMKTQYGERIHDIDIVFRTQKRYRELKKALSYVRQKKNRNDFERILANTGSEYIAAGKTALSYIMDNASKISAARHCLMHGDCNYHNVIISQGEGIFTDMKLGVLGPQAVDLYDFLRKVMEKNGYNIELGLELIGEYEDIRQLSECERIILGGCFYFPEKYWKIINSYYNRKKTLPLNNHLEKLICFMEQESVRTAFVQTLLQQNL